MLRARLRVTLRVRVGFRLGFGLGVGCLEPFSVEVEAVALRVERIRVETAEGGCDYWDERLL